MSEKRKQINFRTDKELEADIDWLRRIAPPPVPSVSDVIREAVAEKVKRERAENKRGARR